jgi:hypothetical protein
VFAEAGTSKVEQMTGWVLCNVSWWLCITAVQLACEATNRYCRSVWVMGLSVPRSATGHALAGPEQVGIGGRATLTLLTP